jgi:hypothetical protein
MKYQAAKHQLGRLWGSSRRVHSPTSAGSWMYVGQVYDGCWRYGCTMGDGCTIWVLGVPVLVYYNGGWM